MDVQTLIDRGTLTRMAAFAEQLGGGNPAGVWIGEELPSAEMMKGLAAAVGYSETAFLVPSKGDGLAGGNHVGSGTGSSSWQVRYFSPEMEVPFCGHATIASGVVLGQRFGAGLHLFQTAAGEIPVEVRQEGDGAMVATLTSVEPSSRAVDPGTLHEALRCLGWTASQLEASIPPAIAFAGASHLVLAVAQRATLAKLDYEFEDLATLMRSCDLITLQLVWQQDETTFHARNPFAVGGVVEDPATGAAAAALGGYLREIGHVDVPAKILIHQGDDMGRPSRLHVTIPATGGISVTGRGQSIDGD